MNNQPKNIQDEIREAIAEELKISNLSVEEQEEVIGNLGAIALQSAMIDVLDTLSEEKREEFSKLIEQKKEDKVMDFLKREVPNYGAITNAAIAEEVRRFQEFQKIPAD